MTTVSAPSPSTRASALTLIVLRAMTLGLRAERLAVSVEGTVEPMQVALARAEGSKLSRQRDRIRRLHRSIAAVTAAIVAGAQRTAAGVSDRAEAWRSVRDQHTDIASELALDADAMRRHGRLAPGEEGGDH